MGKDYKKIALGIIERIGGEENVVSVEHCMTRLRFQLVDDKKANKEELTKVEGVIEVLEGAGQYQCIIGSEVDDVYNALVENTNIKCFVAEENTEGVMTTKKNKKMDIFSLIAELFLPALYAVIGSTIIKGFLLLFSNIGWIAETSTTYTILDTIGSAALYYLPILLAVTAAKKFKANIFIALVVAATLCHPTIAGLYGVEGVTLFGIPINMISYTNSVFPIIAAVYFQSLIEKALNKYLPKTIRSTFAPALTLLIVMIITLLVIGPVLDFLTNILANVISFLVGLNPLVAAMLIGVSMPFLQIFGLHYAVLPIVLYNFATYGYDYISIISIGFGTAVTGALVAVAVRTKKNELRQQALSTSFVALVGGITEPGIYGVLLKQKRLYVATAVVSGIGGVWLTYCGATLQTMLSWNVFTYPAFIAMFGMPMIVYILWLFVGGFTATFLLFKDSAFER